jgi:hypothetical protein
MGTRYVELRRAVRGLTCSAVPLVAFDGLRYRPAGWADDPGLYFFVPEIARIFHLSLPRVVDGLLTGVVLLASAFGLWGFLRTTKTKLGRRIGVVAFLLLTVVVLVAGDVYVMNAAPAIACVPWLLYFLQRQKITTGMLIAFAVTGLLGEMASLFRGQAGTGLLLFTVVATAGLYQVKPAKRVLLLMLLLLGTAGPAVMFRELFAGRNAFLEHQSGALVEANQTHPFWHSIYIGLAFVRNSDVPEYRDEVGFAKVKALRPDAVYPSPEYEQALKQEVFRLAEHRPLLILANLFTKLLVVLLLIIASTNVGLYAAKLARQPACLNLAFWSAIAFNGLFGILVIPNWHYLVGLIAFAALYGVYSIEYAAEQPNLQIRLNWIERLVLVGYPHKAVVPLS